MAKKKQFTTISKADREVIESQIADEIDFARRHKEGKISNWQKNESMYYSDKEKSEDSRANVDLARMQEHVHTLLSKIDTPLTFLFKKRKDAQLKRVERLNALKTFDSDRDNWDIKDIAGKKQMAIYGRAVFSYFATSEEKYTPNLDNTDVYRFLVDPSAGGLDLEKARYLGDYGVVKTRQDLEDTTRTLGYVKDNVKLLLEGDGTNSNEGYEHTRESNRIYANDGVDADREKSDPDKFILWRWGTTYKGVRYYALFDEDAGNCIRLVKWNEMSSSNMWWYWTYAAYPDLTEFWTPSPCDYVREIFMAQAISINQMIDNAEQINKPQKIVDVTAVQNLSEVKYRKNGIIRAKAGLADKAIKVVETPSINTPIQVFSILETIQQRSSGMTDAAKGVEDTDGRATIYEGNVAAAADRFGMFNKSYSFGYKRFAKMYECGVKDHLVKKIAVDILGPDGLDLAEFSRRDIFRANDDFGVLVESSNSELAISEQKKRNTGAFYGNLIGNPVVDQEEVVRELGHTFGVDEETINRLLDKSANGNERTRAEAARDIELLLDGQDIKPNRRANSAYMQYIVNFMTDHEDNIDDETFDRMVQYMQQLKETVVANTVRAARDTASREAAAANGVDGETPLRVPGQAQPLNDVIEQNVN